MEKGEGREGRGGGLGVGWLVGLGRPFLDEGCQTIGSLDERGGGLALCEGPKAPPPPLKELADFPDI